MIDLDDVETLERLDVADMMPAVASGAAQIREAILLSAEARLGALAEEERPRSIVVLGMGGSGVSGDVLAAVAGLECPVPIHVNKTYDLPAWLGATDLVIVVSYSGGTEETVSAATEAARRGARLVVVAATKSAVSAIAEQNKAIFVPMPGGRQPRASLWSLATPVLIAGAALNLCSASNDELEATARRLEEAANTCGPQVESFLNPAKLIAQGLQDRLAIIWGTTPMAGAAAYRFACQINENGKHPATWGLLPEANHNQVVGFDGPLGALRGATDGAGAEDPMFADEATSMGLHLILLRDRTEEHPQVTRRANVSAELARARGVLVTEVVATGGSRLERLASLIGPTDWASVYVGLQSGIDPSPVEAIEELKKRIAR